METCNIKITLDIVVESIEQLKVLVNKLLDISITSFVISENKQVIGSIDYNNILRSKSSLPYGYTVTIYATNFEIADILK